MTEPFRQFLEPYWVSCGLPAGMWPAARATFARYRDLIEAGNASAALMGSSWREDFEVKHLADSLSLLAAYREFLTPPPAGLLRLADVGAGAGLPGLVLAVALPHIRLTAIESIHKKAEFIARAAGELGLAERVEVAAARSKDLQHEPRYAGQFDLVTARAVASAEKLIRDSRLLLAPGGSLILYKTPPAVAEEMPLAQREAAKHKLTVSASDLLDLPAGAGARQFVRIRN